MLHRKNKTFHLAEGEVKEGTQPFNVAAVVVVVVVVVVVGGGGGGVAVVVIAVIRALAWKACLAFAKMLGTRKWIRLDF